MDRYKKIFEEKQGMKEQLGSDPALDDLWYTIDSEGLNGVGQKADVRALKKSSNPAIAKVVQDFQKLADRLWTFYNLYEK